MFKNNTHFQDDDIGSIKVSQASRQFRFQNKTHGIAVKYVEKGTEYYIVNNRTIELHAGQFAIFPCEINYQVYGSQGKQTNGVCVDIHPILLSTYQQTSQSAPLPMFTPYQCTQSTHIGNSISALLQSNISSRCGSDHIRTLAESLEQFSDEVNILDSAIAKEAKKHATRQILISKLLYSREYIFRNFHQKISLDDLAQHTGLSKYHLARLFKRCFAQTPHAQQEQYRMHKARELLTTEELSITTIAHLLGYSDLAAFSNSFKQYWHTTPSRFRVN